MAIEPVGRRTQRTALCSPLRHTATLGSLNCWLCGAGPFTECDVVAHQAYANSLFSCTACGAEAGDVCAPKCSAANTVLDALSAVHAL